MGGFWPDFGGSFWGCSATCSGVLGVFNARGFGVSNVRRQKGGHDRLFWWVAMVAVCRWRLVFPSGEEEEGTRKMGGRLVEMRGHDGGRLKR